MNFLTRSNKHNIDRSDTTNERRRFAPISKLIVTGLASAGLFLAGCAEAKEPAPAPPTTSVTTEAAPVTTAPQPTPEQHRNTESINSAAIKNIQEQAHERWPSTKSCAFAFYTNGSLNIDIVDESLKAAIEEFAYQGNPDLVPATLAGREPASTYQLSEDQKAVISLSAEYIAEQTGHIDNPGGRIGVCKVPQGTALEDQSAFIVLNRGPSTERTDK